MYCAKAAIFAASLKTASIL